MTKKIVSPIESAALWLTRWVGSLGSIIAHTVIFTGSFALVWLGVLPFERMLLVLTTLVSLEAIYLSIFIQMSVNNAKQSLEEVEQDIDEIQEDINEIQEDVDEIQEDVDEIQEDVEEMTEEEKEEKAGQASTPQQQKTIEDVRRTLEQLMIDLEHIQKRS